jgi:hypothetical protein
MWQVPYFFALLHPVRFKNFLCQALIMQTIGTVGETILRTIMPGEYQLLRRSIQRFIMLDVAGVVLLQGAILLIRQSQFMETME